MPLNLQNKKAIVTGGTRGIGRAIVEMLLLEGATVLLCGKSKNSVEKAIAEIRAGVSERVYGVACNITQRAEILNLFAYSDDCMGCPDILVNNAGIGIFGSVADLAPEDWQRTIDTNLTAVFHFCQLAIERFRQRQPQGGFVVNVGSLAGKNAFAGGAAYNASKFGLLGFTEALLLDHRNIGLRACSVMPGSVSTEFGGSQSLADWKIQPQDIAEVVRTVLLMPERTMVSRVEIRPSRPPK